MNQNQLAYLDGKSNFFLEFTDERFFGALPKFNSSAGKKPIAFSVFFVAHKEYFVVFEKDSGDPYSNGLQFKLTFKFLFFFPKYQRCRTALKNHPNSTTELYVGA